MSWYHLIISFILFFYHLKYVSFSHQAGGTLLYYAGIFSLYSVVQFLACWCFGWLSDRRPIKEVLFILAACLLAGNLMFCVTDDTNEHRLVWMLMGRAVCGLGSAIGPIGYAHIVRYES